MPEIRPVTVQPIQVPEIRGVPEIRAVPAPSVTARPGFPEPVVMYPGCVPVHPDQKLNPSLLKDDPNRVGMFCPDGEVPAFTPMDYDPSELVILEESAPQTEAPRDKPGSVKPAEVPRLPPANPPGDQSTAEESKPAKPIVEQVVEGLPEIPIVVTTATIAAVAATSALLAKPLADLILKVIKPTVKKVIKKISTLRGKTVRRESVWERRLAQRDRNRALMALRRALKP